MDRLDPSPTLYRGLNAKRGRQGCGNTAHDHPHTLPPPLPHFPLSACTTLTEPRRATRSFAQFTPTIGHELLEPGRAVVTEGGHVVRLVGLAARLPQARGILLPRFQPRLLWCGIEPCHTRLMEQYLREHPGLVARIRAGHGAQPLRPERCRKLRGDLPGAGVDAGSAQVTNMKT